MKPPTLALGVFFTALAATATCGIALINANGSSLLAHWGFVGSLVVVPIACVLAVRGAPVNDRAAAGPSLGGRSSALWIGHAAARWPLYVAAVLGAVASVLYAVSVLATIGVAFAAIATLAFVAIEVRIGDRSLEVAYFGPLRWPKTQIALVAVRQVEEIEILPRRHGWGYRGSLRLIGRAAVVIRRGEGILLTLEDNRQFVVTVDDAAAGCRALRRLVQPAGWRDPRVST
jgi:hypothetical protein